MSDTSVASVTCRFTVLGHACLAVEAGLADGSTFRIVVDPWLLGSCYWRSWWHYPSAPDVADEWWHPDVVIPSHHHADHLHYPTLRRFDRRARMVIPRFGVDVMAPELRTQGFHDITEVDHGRSIELAPGVTYSSYHYGFDDSVVVLRIGDTVLVDLNDAKIRGRALRQVVDDVGPPTVAFKTHSWAQAYPLSYTADDEADLQLVTEATFVSDFLEAARVLRPRYMIPFASDVAFLHPQSCHVNERTVSRQSVQRAMEAAGPAGTETVDLRPGESWNSETGFERRAQNLSEDPDTRRRTIAARTDAVRATLEAQATHEAGVRCSFEQFQRYFDEFVHAVPLPARSLAGRRPIVFAAPWSDPPFWIVDLRRRSVTAAAAVPDDAASVVAFDEALLAEGIENRILHFAQGSFRQRSHVHAGGLSDDLGFWGLVMIFEIGYLPLRSSLRPRAVGVAARRWREGLDALGALVRGRGQSPLERLAGGFTAESDPAVDAS